jgi:hypothetical protein
MTDFQKLSFPDFSGLSLELETMLSSNKIYWKSNQICLTSTEQFPNDFTYGVGSLILDWKMKTDIGGNQSSYEVVKKTNILRESDFNLLCPVFRNTKFEQIYEYAKLKFSIGRTRIMMLQPKTCLSWHTDTTRRLHYVIKTNKGARMVVENESQHLQENGWYLINTTKFHTAFNGSLETRIHLVFSILE